MEMNIHFLSVQVSASGATSISAKKKSGVAIEVRPSPLENRYVKAALH